MNTKVVTFDCYGTLIDWDRGVLSAVRSSCPASIFLDDRTLLQAFDQAEAIELSGCYRPYRDILAETGRSIARKFNLGSSELASALSTSVGGWPAFDDTVSALTTVRDAIPSLRIGILSNIDIDLLQMTMQQQFDEFCPDFAITADSVRSYKPGLAHFEKMLATVGCHPSEVLHVAQSVRHDIVPGRQLGFQTCWVRRRRLGAELVRDVQSDHVIDTLGELHSLLEHT